MGSLMHWAVVLVLTVGILITPIAHQLKPLFSARAYYHHLDARDRLKERVTEELMILIGNDAFLPPVLEHYYRYVVGGRGAPVYVLFPPLIGKENLEQELWQAFAHQLMERPDRRMLLGANFGADAIVEDVATIKLELATLHFKLDEMLYQVHDGGYFIGSLLEIRDNTDQVLYRVEG